MTRQTLVHEERIWPFRAQPPGASRYVPGWQPLRGAWGADTTDECTPGRQDARSWPFDSCHEGHRRFVLAASSASLAAPESNAGCPPFRLRWFGWPRPAPVPRLADSGETALVVALEAWSHQTSDPE